MQPSKLSVPKIAKILKLMRESGVLAFELGDFKVTFEPPRATPATTISAPGLNLVPAIKADSTPSDEELLYASAGGGFEIPGGSR